MNRRLIIRPEAEVDITQAALWYENREDGCVALLHEIGAAIDRALTQPEAFTRVRQQPPIHRVLVRRFPYRIFYIVTPEGIVIFAVLHAARDEELWQNRVRT